MSGAPTVARARVRDRARLRPVSLSVLLSLGIVYFSLAVLYDWQASRHVTPTIFSDEIKFAEISRGIAASGRPELRGAPTSFDTLYEYLAAPAWWLHNTQSAYDAIKTLGVLLMASVVFPAYGLARLVVSSRWALFVAAGAAVAPALAYAPFLVEEPLAYPVSALALWLIARCVAFPSRWSIGLAFGGCVLGALARGQLAVLMAVFGLGLLVPLWRWERFRRYRTTWSTGDWAGAIALVLGAVFFGFAFLGHHSQSWYIATAYNKHRMFDLGLWAFGALAIGLGLVPFVVGLAGLVRTHEERADPGMRGFLTVAFAALAAFGFYTAVKAAYLSTTFSTLILERNVIYLTPVLFVGTALALSRGVRLWPLLGAAALAIYIVHSMPLKIDIYPYYESPGLALAALANREFVWPAGTIVTALSVIAVATVVVLLAPRFVRDRRVLYGAVGLVAAVALALPLTAEVYAANGFSTMTKQFLASSPSPPDWLDRTTGGASTTYLGQQINDPNGVWLLEFWNRSLKKVWSTDGSAPGPGPSLTPNLAAPDGTLAPSPETDYILPDRGVQVVGAPLKAPQGTVYRLDGPLRLRASQADVYSDGWIAGFAAYNRFDVRPGQRVLAKVELSRAGWCGPNVPGHVVVRVGTVVVGSDHEPALGRVTDVQRGTINACKTVTFALRAPRGPWRAEVHISPTFSPHDLDARSSDLRQLGAVVSWGEEPLR